MLNKILSLSQDLISVKSNPGNLFELNKCLEIALSNLKEYSIERFEKDGVKSALVYNSPKRPNKFKVILNAHLDVIPGKDHQYIPYIKGNKLFGVGALDMKSNAACMILVFKEVAKKVNYPLALQLVTDEEVGGFKGTQYQIDRGVKAEFVIAGETTNFDIVNKAKGVLWVKISAKGKTAHGAYPWRGKNAIWEMINFLDLLKNKFPLTPKEQWITTINLSSITTSNKTFNKIPDNCEALLDIRYIPEESNSILATIKSLMPSGFKMELIAKEPAMMVDENNQYIKKIQKIGTAITRKRLRLRGANGSSDARHFTKVNCPGIEFGPIGGGIGSDEEWIDISSLETYANILKEFLLDQHP